ncbi:inositol monophosphatase family protein [Aeromicrobium chenweiae]|uniref:Inositol-1-monophosphatase n=1 Tax=Aeromicrobium chenweiae TaxID=2079793 RepID=A0A2S0WL47_9ACTN|nr:inositol monophosphatase family protein [Aeromicrobium chenweiae]AWB92073.1 inositol monophosphatase [Aeromicrobium chenweiae]TGN32922.1 inositol monophosphatase [Aeromicrobium chenweiae]
MSQELYDLARAVGLEAAEFVRSSRPEGRVDVAATKSSDTDVVTEIDRACERLIRERIFSARPDDGFAGEEGDDIVGTSGVDWVVDPIDGTVNFVHGIPAYAVSIAARRDGTVVAGHVVNIASGEEHGAVRGEGAWRHDGDERRAVVAPQGAAPARGLVATGFHYIPEIRAKQAAAMASFLPQVADVRRIGSAALDLCALAEGHYDAYFEQGLHLWDHAAGALVATESGLVVSGLDGGPDERMVMSAHPAVAEEYFGLVRSCGF